MKYLILGNGWLGQKIKNYLGADADLWLGDIRDFGKLPIPHFKEYGVIINTAAKTNIDWCEQHKLEAFSVNVSGAVEVANVCMKSDKKYVFLSSACIFESEGKTSVAEAASAKHFIESDKPNPQCWYSETKVLAEKLIQEVCPDALILRPRLPISEVPHPRNTLNKLLNYEYLNDNQESITIVEDMLPVMKQLIEDDSVGVYHLVNAGTLSPKELGEAIGHSFKLRSKAEQDRDLKEQGRAKRVTTYVESERIELLPDIRGRITTLAANFRSATDKASV